MGSSVLLGRIRARRGMAMTVFRKYGIRTAVRARHELHP
jgi:hypothetical protein